MDSATKLRLHPQVSVRPEPFGALLYHFGTRKLTFLKDTVLFDAVTALGEGATVADVLDSLQVTGEHRRLIENSLAALTASDMLEEVPA